MEEKRRKLIIVSVISLIVLLLISFVGFLIYRNSIDSAGDNDGSGSEIYENSAVFENRPIINAAIGPDATVVILDDVSSFIFSEAEMQTAKYANTANYEMSNYYNVKINNDLLAYDTSFIYKVSVDVSDGRRYELSFRTDEEYGYRDFVMMAMKNLDTNKGAIYININNDNWQQLTDWMREFSGLENDAEIIIEHNPLVDEGTTVN